MKRAGAMLLVTALWAASANAADLDVKPPPDKPAPPAAATIFTPPDATCVEWTDGCRVCIKPAAGDATCSNVGAACTPQAPRCTRR